MPDLSFFYIGCEISLAQAILFSDARLIKTQNIDTLAIKGCAPLSLAGFCDVSFFSDKRYLASLHATKAGFVFVHERDYDQVPENSIGLIVNSPQAAWSILTSKIHLIRHHNGPLAIHPTAQIEDNVEIGYGVVIGQGAQIGSGTRLDSYCIIGPGCSVGRDCVIGAHTSISCSRLGDRVKISAGARIGEAGFGVSADKNGLIDVPQLGRVIIQDNVSIGASTCIDRGAYNDTLIGEGTKIDNMVQIAHNVQVGRNCIIAAHSGISGSVKIGDGAMFGGRAGIIDHIEIGSGAKITAGAIVLRDVPPNSVWAGFPAKASRQFLRESAWLAKQAGLVKQTGLAKQADEENKG